MPALLFSQNEESVLTVLKLKNLARICAHDLSGEVCGIVAIFEQDNFGRGTKRVTKSVSAVRIAKPFCRA